MRRCRTQTSPSTCSRGTVATANTGAKANVSGARGARSIAPRPLDVCTSAKADVECIACKIAADTNVPTHRVWQASVLSRVQNARMHARTHAHAHAHAHVHCVWRRRRRRRRRRLSRHVQHQAGGQLCGYAKHEDGHAPQTRRHFRCLQDFGPAHEDATFERPHQPCTSTKRRPRCFKGQRAALGLVFYDGVGEAGAAKGVGWQWRWRWRCVCICVVVVVGRERRTRTIEFKVDQDAPRRDGRETIAWVCNSEVRKPQQTAVRLAKHAAHKPASCGTRAAAASDCAGEPRAWHLGLGS